MSLAAVGISGLLLVCVFGADDSIPPPPALKATPEPVSPTRKTRHYVVQVKVIEVDEQGKETVLGEPRIQTTGGNAGISVDHPDGRRFEFTMRLADRQGSGEALMPARIPGKLPAVTATRTTDDALVKKLDQKIDLNIQQQSRLEILREIHQRTEIGILIDPENAKPILAEMAAPTSLVVKNESVADVLDRLLQPLKLVHVASDEIVKIVTSEKLAATPGELTVKTYNVADLVISKDDAGNGTSDFGPLIERIKSTVQPASWDRKETPATIRPFNSTLSIVVRQTPPAHAAIERLLERSRREQPKQTSE